MPKITLTVEAETPDEARATLLRLLGEAEHFGTTPDEERPDWTPSEMRLFLGRLQPGARRILTTVAAAGAEGLVRDELAKALGVTTGVMGGQRSSIGFAMRKYRPRPYPLNDQGGRYRIEEPLATMIRDLTSEEKPG